ncbi:MAG: thioredoxin-disulfide reductase [Verrucomicrobia bacterium]|nr:thioredoxin-disulfide reductase [Verrucomicrobiota bacterium]
MRKQAKVVIIGSGPAGYTAAVYAARANLEPLLFAGFHSGPAGGQLMTTTDVENYPGFPEGITGPKLMETFRKQAERFGTEVVMKDVSSVNLAHHPFKIMSGDTTVEAEALIIATGATAKLLPIPGAGEGELWQKGVSACAVCDGAMPIFRNKPLYVIGGGDSAVEEAIFLTKFGSRVYIVHRRDTLRASLIMGERAKHHPKVEILWNSVCTAVEGKEVVESVTIQNLVTKKEEKHPAGGLFFAIGHQPNTGFLGNQLELDDVGYLKVDKGTSHTNIPGVFAAGDVFDHRYRQAITAAGSGCMAALDAERWLAARGEAQARLPKEEMERDP